MDDVLGLGLSWLPAIAAGLLCIAPAVLFFMLLLFWPIEDLPSDGPPINLELLGKRYPLAAPALAVVLVGPDGDMAAVITVTAGVIAGLTAFVVAWEPLLRLAGGHSPARATIATVAAIVISVGLMLLVTRWLPSWLEPRLVAAVVGIPTAVVVAIVLIGDRRSNKAATAAHVAPGPTVPEGIYPVKWINLDDGAGHGVLMSDPTISLTPRRWRVEWRGSRWLSQPRRCQVRLEVDAPAFGTELSVVCGQGRYEPGPEGSELGGIVEGTIGHLLNWRDKPITVVPSDASGEGLHSQRQRSTSGPPGP